MSALLCRVAVVCALAAFGVPALAQDLASASYRCQLRGADLGTVEIDGGRYRAGGGDWQGFRRIGPAIVWGGALGQISAAGDVVGSVVQGPRGFDVQLRAKNSGQFELVTCRA